MQEDLQASEHLPQRVHLLSANFILKSEIFESKPSNVPTGQIILQYRRPLIRESMAVSSKKTTGIEYVMRLNPLMSI